MEFSWIHGLIIGAAAVIGAASTYVFKLKPDNPIEQIAEEVIQKETGVVVDLSPESVDSLKDNKK